LFRDGEALLLKRAAAWVPAHCTGAACSIPIAMERVALTCFLYFGC